MRFAPDGGGTRVDLEHRQWERLGDRAQALQAGYDDGWGRVLGLFAEAVHAA